MRETASPPIHYVWTHWLNVPAEFFLRATRSGSRWYPHSVIGMRVRCGDHVRPEPTRDTIRP